MFTQWADAGGEIAMKEMKSAESNCNEQEPFDELEPCNQENGWALRRLFGLAFGRAGGHVSRVRIARHLFIRGGESGGGTFGCCGPNLY